MHGDLILKFQELQRQREIDEAVNKACEQERKVLAKKAAEKEAKAVVAKLVQIFGLSKGQAEDYYRHTMTPA